jgi:tetratricopeptide (TPR) repeat protein
MRSFLAVVALLTPLAVAQGQPSDKDRLRELVNFPSVFVGTGFEFSDNTGWYLKGQKPSFAAQFAKLPDQQPLRALRLAQLLAQFNATFLSELVYGQAALQTAERRTADADNVDLLLIQAQALSALYKQDQTAPLLERALQLAPDNPRVWLTLGHFRVGEAWRAMMEIDPSHFQDQNALRQLVMQGLIPRANADRAAEKLQKAIECADRAVQLAPKNPETWWGRASIRFTSGTLDTFVHLARGEIVSPVPMVFSREMIDDLKEFARLDPGSGVAMAGAAYFDVVQFNARPGDGPRGFGPEVIKAMPPASQEYMTLTIQHLETVAAGDDRRAAAEASEALAWMGMVMLMDFGVLEKHSRRVVELVPSRGPAWAMLMTAVGCSGRPEEALAVAKQRMPHDDSADAHFHLGLAWQRNERWDEAEKEVRAALERDPQHVMARLALAACLLRNGASDDAFNRAAALLDELEKLPADVQTEQSKESWKALQAVRLALVGEKAQANALFDDLARSHKGNMTYQMGMALTSGQVINAAALRATVAEPWISDLHGVQFLDTLAYYPSDVPSARDMARLKADITADPENSDKHFQLGQWHAMRRELDRSRAAFLRAAELYQKRLADKPGDVVLLRQTALALARADHPTAGVELLEKALAQAPQEGELWHALSIVLVHRAYEEMDAESKGGGVFIPVTETPAEAIQRMQVAAPGLERANACLARACECSEKAAALAPGNAEIYLQRGLIHIYQQNVKVAAQLQRGDKTSRGAAQFVRDALPDVQKAASLRPADVRLQGAVLMEEFGMLALELGLDAMEVRSAEILARMPAAFKDKLAQGLAPLEARLDQLPAAEAEVVVFLIGSLSPQRSGDDDARVRAVHRRLLERFPERPSSWDLFDGYLCTNGKNEEVLALRLERLRHLDCPDNRFWAARGYGRMKQWAEAEKQVREGLKQDPQHILCNLTLASLLLRRECSVTEMTDVFLCLQRLDKAVTPDTPLDNVTDWIVLGATYEALLGHDLQATALLARVERLWPNHPGAARVREAMRTK